MARPPGNGFHRLKNGAVKHMKLKAKLFRIFNHPGPIFLRIARIHRKIGYPEGHIAVFSQFPKAYRQGQGILAP